MEKAAKQNSTEGFYIFADDSASPGTGKTGLTISTMQSKNGAAATAISPTITERDDVADGLYWVAPIAAHRDTLGRTAFGFSATGAIIAPRLERVIAFDVEDAAALGLAVLRNKITATDLGGGVIRLAFRNDADTATLLTVDVTPATGDRSVV